MAATLRHEGRAEELMRDTAQDGVAAKRPRSAAAMLGQTEGASAPSYLSVAGLTKRFGAATVVADVAFEVAASEFLCVLGPSGCGKTTLLRLIAGFERADGGSIRQAGIDITHLPPEARDYGIVFQSYALFPNRTVGGNLAFGLEAVGAPRATREAKVAELLTLVGLQDHAHKYPNQLSGGQQQRVALARALALSPGLLLLDEPLSALDANVRAHLRDELRALQKRVGVTAMMVTHDQVEALSIADRIIVMNGGRIEQIGTPSEVYERPDTLFVAKFLADMNTLPIARADGAVVQAAGLTWVLERPQGQLPANPQLCIRPAAVLVGEAARGAPNGFAARVAHVAFLGDLVRLTLQPDANARTTLDADVLRASLSIRPRTGDMVHACLPPRHVLVLGGDV
jgi:iron(III) transport system ATP-binding protein